MWTCEHVLPASVDAAAVWARYSDPTGWPAWDQPRSTVDFEGEFAAGAKGRLTINGGRTSTFTLLHVEPLSSYTDRTRLGTSRIIISHRITPVPQGVLLTHAVTLNGPFSNLLGSFLGSRISSQQSAALKRLVALLEA